jgi:V-type H+-transporting ATPase subunit a
MEVFKTCVFKLAILFRIQRLTDGYTRRGSSIRDRFNQDQDNEYQAASNLNEESTLL